MNARRPLAWRRAVAIASAWAAFAGCSSVPSLESDDPLGEIVRHYERTVGDPSCSVALVEADGSVRFGGDPRKLYRVASLTKLVLHAVFEELVAAGAVDPDRPVLGQSRLDLPPEFARVSLRDLLESRSGLPREFLDPANPLDWGTALACGFFGSHVYGGFETSGAMARELRSSRVRRMLRRREERYSNVGFGLFAMTLEDVTGRPLEDLIARSAAAGDLADTVFAPEGERLERTTAACAGKLPWLVRRGSVVPEHRLGEALRGAGGLFSTAADCAVFLSRYRRLLDRELARRPLSERAEGELVGLCRVKTLASGKRVLHRFGMIYGGASFAAYDPASGRVMAILRNVTSWTAADDFAVADRLFRGRPKKDDAKTAKRGRMGRLDTKTD